MSLMTTDRADQATPLPAWYEGAHAEAQAEE